MSDINDFHKNYLNAKKALNKALDIYAENISTGITKMKDKNERVDYLNNMTKVPSARVLKKVNEKALENEDYETCGALKEYAKQQNIKF
jgi:predicted DNA-binding protein